MLEPEFSAKDIIKNKVVKMSIIDKFLDVMRLMMMITNLITKITITMKKRIMR